MKDQEIGMAREAGTGRELFEIVHEDAELLVVNKPADLVCHPTKGDVYSSLISRVRLHLGAGSNPQMINRLDRETSGLVLVAKNEVAARELRRIWERRAVEKDYLAVVHGAVAEAYGVIDAPLGCDERSRVAIKDCVRADGAESRTEFWRERIFARGAGEFSVLRVRPHTGRKHQIRIHLAHRGHPIVGDKLYAGEEDCYLALVEGRLTEAQRGRLILWCHALHAGRVRFEWRGREVILEVGPEKWLADFIEGVGANAAV